MVHIWNPFGVALDFASSFLKNGGAEALKRNIEADPQISTGDAEFDVIAADIFQRVGQRDPLVLNWNDEFKPIVGLYDQATKGNIPEHLKCRGPDGAVGLVQAGWKDGKFSMDRVVDKCRRGEHTVYYGMSQKDAIQEFKVRVAQLYANSDQPLPVPTLPQRDLSPISSETQFESGFSDQGSYSSGYYTPVEGIPLALESARIKDGGNSIVGNVPMGQTIAMGNERSTVPVNPASGSAMKAYPMTRKVLAPAATLQVMAGTVIGFGLIAGAILVYKSIFRRKRKPEMKESSRVHARSWNLAPGEQF